MERDSGEHKAGAECVTKAYGRLRYHRIKQFQICCLLAVWYWASHLTTLSYKMIGVLPCHGKDSFPQPQLYVLDFILRLQRTVKGTTLGCL
jgi:hypothetical protein